MGCIMCWLSRACHESAKESFLRPSTRAQPTQASRRPSQKAYTHQARGLACLASTGPGQYNYGLALGPAAGRRTGAEAHYEHVTIVQPASSLRRGDLSEK